MRACVCVLCPVHCFLQLPHTNSCAVLEHINICAVLSSLAVIMDVSVVLILHSELTRTHSTRGHSKPEKTKGEHARPPLPPSTSASSVDSPTPLNSLLRLCSLHHHALSRRPPRVQQQLVRQAPWWVASLWPSSWQQPPAVGPSRRAWWGLVVGTRVTRAAPCLDGLLLLLLVTAARRLVSAGGVRRVARGRR